MLYGRRDEAILSLWLVSVSTDDCGHTLTTKNGTVSLDCNMVGVSSASSNHIAIRSTAAKIQLPIRKILLLRRSNFEMVLTNGLFKGTHNNGKDLLTNRKDRFKGLKRPFIEKSISKDLKGPKRNLLLGTE